MDLNRKIYQTGKTGRLVKEVKSMLVDMLSIVCRELPAPIREELKYKNSRALYDMRDDFLAREIPNTRRRQFTAAFNMIIYTYEQNASKVLRVFGYDVGGLFFKIICNQLPCTRDQNRYKNAHTLTDIKEKLLGFDIANVATRREIETFFNLATIVYNFDHYYREREDVIVWWLKTMDWDFSEYKGLEGGENNYRSIIDWIVWRLKEVEWEVIPGEPYPRSAWWYTTLPVEAQGHAS